MLELNFNGTADMENWKLSKDAYIYLFFFMFLEIMIIKFKEPSQKYSGYDIADSITSVNTWIFSQLPLVFFKSLELITYNYVYINFKIMKLPENSPVIWFMTFIFVDFCFYWLHRASHEISLFWCAHQVHHSSERFNLTTSLRQSILQKYFSWIFYLPMAFFIPTRIFTIHLQLNFLYQCFLHTEVVGDLGILEWVFNTPKHHRIHHGRNKYCIDKNFGGILIVFDKLFDTYSKEFEQIAFGLVKPLETWDIMKIQLGYFNYLKSKIENELFSRGDKVRALIFGPSWFPGTRRLGDRSQFKEPDFPINYHKPVTTSFTLQYCIVNFVLVNLGYYWLISHSEQLTIVLLSIISMEVLGALYQIGRIFEGGNVFRSECFRWISLLCLIPILYNSMSSVLVVTIFGRLIFPQFGGKYFY